MPTRKASIKETGEELSPEEWERFDAAVAEEKATRPKTEPIKRRAAQLEPTDHPEGAETKRPGTR